MLACWLAGWLAEGGCMYVEVRHGAYVEVRHGARGQRGDSIHSDSRLAGSFHGLRFTGFTAFTREVHNAN